MSIEELEERLAALVLEYVRSLSTNAPQSLDRVRLEATGNGIAVTYDKHEPDGAPVLGVNLTALPQGRRRG